MELSEIIHSIEQGSIEVAPRRQDSQIIQDKNWYQIITPSVRHFRFNRVFFSNIDHPSEINQKIKKTVEEFHRYNLPFRWEVGPNCQSSDLGHELISAGFQFTSEAIGMVAKPSQIHLETNPEISVEIVKNEAQVEKWVKTFLSGWALPSDIYEAEKDIVSRNIRAHTENSFYFLAYFQGKPAGAAEVHLFHQVGYFQSGCVTEEFRGRGVYKALMKSRIDFLRKSNLPIAVIQGIKDSTAPICRKLGFEAICTMQIYDMHLPQNPIRTGKQYELHPHGPPNQNKLVLDDILRWESSSL